MRRPAGEGLQARQRPSCAGAGRIAAAIIGRRRNPCANDDAGCGASCRCFGPTSACRFQPAGSAQSAAGAFAGAMQKGASSGEQQASAGDPHRGVAPRAGPRVAVAEAHSIARSAARNGTNTVVLPLELERCQKRTEEPIRADFAEPSPLRFLEPLTRFARWKYSAS